VTPEQLAANLDLSVTTGPARVDRPCGGRAWAGPDPIPGRM